LQNHESNGLDREALIFIAPGLVHRLGNAMFTIQGHVQLMADVESSPADRQTILQEARRGSRALTLMRTLVGHEQVDSEAAADVLVVVGELLAIPVREAGHTLVVQPAGAVGSRAIRPGTFYPAVIHAVRLLLQALPQGRPAGIELRVDAGEHEQVEVAVRFVPQEGNLPFPLAMDGVVEELRVVLARLRGRPALRMTSRGFVVTFGAQGGRAEAVAEQ